MNIASLASQQNPDGGWPYRKGSSWTEPTVYSMLAMLAAGADDHAARGFQWLRRVARPDGGFAPQAGVEESSWATALAALLPPERLGSAVHDRAIGWLLKTDSADTTPVFRLRAWLLGEASMRDKVFSGWPWTRGAAGWVGPTAIAILALQQENRRKPSPELQRRITEGHEYLLSRTCAGGGWNHGASKALGVYQTPYPETTGMALTALRGVDSPEVHRGVGLAQQYLSASHSADELNWLGLGLTAQGGMPAGYSRPAEVECRTIPEMSLAILLEGAQQGRDMLWG
jgi:Prenyltransferase and squalene oxidase repeat